MMAVIFELEPRAGQAQRHFELANELIRNYGLSSRDQAPLDSLDA